MILDLETPAAWPNHWPTISIGITISSCHGNCRARACLDARYSGFEYDQAIYGLRAVMQPYSLVGLHCTRLTEQEIDHVIAEGMQLPSGEMLGRRVNSLVTAGLVTEAVAARLIAKTKPTSAVAPAWHSGRERHRLVLSVLGRRGIVQLARWRP